MRCFERLTLIFLMMQLSAINVWAMEQNQKSVDWTSPFTFILNIVNALNVDIEANDKELIEFGTEDLDETETVAKVTISEKTHSVNNRQIRNALFDDCAPSENSFYAIGGISEKEYASFLTIDGAILHNLRNDAHYEFNWRSGQRQCSHILYWAYALHGKEAPDNLDIDDSNLQFARYAVPSKLCAFLDERIPREYRLMPSCLQFKDLNEDQLVALVKGQLQKGKPVLAIHTSYLLKTHIRLAAIVGINFDYAEPMLLVIFTTINDSFIQIKSASDVLDIMDMTDIRKVITNEIEARSGNLDQEWLALALELERTLEPFNLIVFGS